MRLPRESLLFLGLATAICALVGVVFGISTGSLVDTSSPRATNTPAATASSLAPTPLTTATPLPLGVSPSPPGPQRSLIVIGVDDAQAANPRLEGVWVVTFSPGINEYYVISFPPSARFHLASLAGEMPMSDIYAEDQRLEIGFHFVRDAIQNRFRAFSIEADVVLDRGDFAGLITSLGELDLSGQPLAGPTLLTTYDQYPADDDASRMFMQQQVFKLLFDIMAAQSWTPDTLLTYIKGLPQVQADAVREAALEAFFVGAPAFADSTLTWRDYLPEMEIGATP